MRQGCAGAPPPEKNRNVCLEMPRFGAFWVGIFRLSTISRPFAKQSIGSYEFDITNVGGCQEWGVGESRPFTGPLGVAFGSSVNRLLLFSVLLSQHFCICHTYNERHITPSINQSNNQSKPVTLRRRWGTLTDASSAAMPAY